MDFGIGEAAAAEGAKAAGEAAIAGDALAGGLEATLAADAVAPIAAGEIGGAAVGAGAADAAGLAQMAADAGLTGQAAADFVSSGGTMGSAAAGGGGVGLGEAMPFGSGGGPVPEGGGLLQTLTNAVGNTPPGFSQMVKGAVGDQGDFTSSIKPTLTTPAPGMGGAAPGAAGSGAPFGVSDVTKFLNENKSLILPGAAMAYSGLNKPKMPEIPNLEQIAQSLHGPGTAAGAAGDAAKSLIPTVSTGNLPAGAQASVQNALQDATASIKSKYASMGMSGSTAEAQELSAAASRAEAVKFDLANQLTKTGLSAAGIAEGGDVNAANIYALIMNEQLKTDAQLSDALSRFALAGSMGAGLNKAA